MTEFLADVYPNPATDVLNVALEGDYTGRVAISVYDLSGSEVMTTTILKETGATATSVNVDRLPAGTYTLSVVAGTHREHRMFVKM